MSSEVFIALLNPAISLVFAGAFLSLWLHQRQRRYVLMFTISYASGVVAFLLQYFVLPIGLEATKLLSNLLFMVTALTLATGILIRLRRPVPWIALLAPALGGFSGFCWFLFVEPDLTWRIFSVNFAFAAITLVTAAEMRAAPGKHPVDRLLMVFLALSGLNFLARTLATVKADGGYQNYDNYFLSLYWVTTAVSHALFSVVIATCLVVVIALEVFDRLTNDSRTDPLTGLCNRRGFEERAAIALARAARDGASAALIVADLDHFKTLNDSHGHAAGDRVIRAFGRLLAQIAGRNAVVARIGGEEFCAILPGCTIAQARIVAETVRASFTGITIDGLPEGIRATASFGVVGPADGVSLQDLLAYADEALYQAKRHGRDSVRVAWRRPEPGVPTPFDLPGHAT
ncbi:MAG: diguanylate cyclase [Rhizobiaceae bacterium]